MRCHNRIGHDLDGLLCTVIRDFVVQEAEAADDEEVSNPCKPMRRYLANDLRHEPLVTPFVEGLFAADLASAILDADTDTDSEHNEGSGVPPPASNIAHPLHVVNFTGINLSGKAKPFALIELPQALRLRFYAGLSNTNLHLKATTTLRRVLWNKDSEQHMFNGAIGHPLPPLGLDQDVDLEALIEFSSFPEIANEKKRARAPPQDPAPARVAHWDFEGEQPTVSQWLSGMGRTRQVDPGDKPDIAADAAKFAGGPSVQQQAAGRIRMPKGVPFAQLQSDSEESQLDEPEKRKEDAFAALMQRGPADDSRTEDSSSDDDSTTSARPVSFAALLRGAPQRAPSRQASIWHTMSQQTQPQQSQTQQSQPQKSQHQQSQPQRVLVQAQAHSPDVAASPSRTKEFQKLSIAAKEPSEAPSASSFPTYDRNYATVDDNGLAGNAANQAQWEIENSIISSSSRSRRARTRDQLRKERETTESTSMSISEGLDVSRWRPTESSATPMSYDDTRLGGSEAWANKVVPSDNVEPSASLVDTSAPKMSRSAFPPLRSQRIQPISTAQLPAPPTGDLIDLSVPTQPPHQPPLVNLPNAAGKALTPRRKQANSRSIAASDSGSIIERLRKEPDVAKPRVHRTMHQKAQNKAKKGKKKSEGKPIKAQLELPDPVPPPPPVKAPTPIAHPPPTLPTVSSSFSDAMATVLEGTAEGTVVVHFGMIFLEASDTLVKAMRATELQEALEKAGPPTEFLKLLTTSIIDARYLLEFSRTFSFSTPGIIDLARAYVEHGEDALNVLFSYELEAVDTSGTQWSVKIDPQQLDQPAIEPFAVGQSCAYLHLPFFVWDAKVVPCLYQTTLEVPGELEEAIQAFAKDLTIPHEAMERAPAFESEASPLFTVQRAQAKRTFVRRMPLGIDGPLATWQVLQVWDLHLRHGPTIVALSKPDAEMAASGRLWWEASMIYTDSDLIPTVAKSQGTIAQGADETAEAGDTFKAAASRLEEVIVKVVEKLDNVGLGGMDAAQLGQATGTQGKASGKKKAKKEAYVPFW